METITSRENAKIKYACAVRDAEKQRAADGLFFAEGPKLCLELAKSCTPRAMYATAAALAKTPELAQFDPAEIAPHVAEKLSGTKSNQGVFALFETPVPPADTLDTARRILMLEGVQDPGNVGTIIRTADAAGLDGVLLSTQCADVFSPKVLRATMGSIFRMNLRTTDDLPGELTKLREKGYSILSSQLDGTPFYERQGVAERFALIIGNEGNGVSEQVQQTATHRVRLPMRGGAESLNAAIAAAIMMYELMR